MPGKVPVPVSTGTFAWGRGLAGLQSLMHPSSAITPVIGLSVTAAVYAGSL